MKTKYENPTAPAMPRAKRAFTLTKHPLVGLSINFLQQHLDEVNSLSSQTWQARRVISESDLIASIEILKDEKDPKIRSLLRDIGNKSNHQSVRDAAKNILE